MSLFSTIAEVFFGEGDGGHPRSSGKANDYDEDVSKINDGTH